MEKQPINSFQEASNQVCLGVVTGPHGIRGAVKIKTFTVNPKDITTYGPLRDEKGVVYRLKVISQPGPDLVVVHVDGVKDRNQAELLRGCRLFVERNALPTTNDDEFYYSDLVGLAVRTTEGNDIGVITSVNNYGAGDFLEAQAQDGQVFTIPFRKEAVISVDLSSRQVTVSAEFVLSTK